MKYGKEGRQKKGSIVRPVFIRGALSLILLGTLEVSVDNHLRIIPNEDEGDGHLHANMHHPLVRAPEQAGSWSSSLQKKILRQLEVEHSLQW